MNSVVSEGPLPIGCFFSDQTAHLHLCIAQRNLAPGEGRKTCQTANGNEGEARPKTLSPGRGNSHIFYFASNPTCLPNTHQRLPRCPSREATRSKISTLRYADNSTRNHSGKYSQYRTPLHLLTYRNRPFQREIILAALAGNDVFVQAATSFGKSLCFQLPAVIDHGSKYLRVSESSRLRVALSDAARFPVTIVISPLLSLMVSPVSGQSVCNKYLR